MSRSWFPIVAVAGLLGLLGLLATLQYRWLGQISDGERERLRRVVQSDAARFADDFDREIQNVYANFQISAADFAAAKNPSVFNDRYDFYLAKTAFPDLVKDFYFVEFDAQKSLKRYDRQTAAFEPAEWTPRLAVLQTKLTADAPTTPVAAEIPALLIPIENAAEPKITQIYIRTTRREFDSRILENLPPAAFGQLKIGVLIVELDAGAIVNRILPALAAKYFGANAASDFLVAVADERSGVVFQTGETSQPDARVKLFGVVPNDAFDFTRRRAPNPAPDSANAENKTTVAKSRLVVGRVEKRAATANAAGTNAAAPRIEIETANAAQISVGERLSVEKTGAWTLSVQHAAGSLDAFIAATKRKNLAISFGILSLLAASVGLIFLSAMRARRFAQRQVDFVSAVSHEFRTPLAVIRSAGENLTDGVVRSDDQIARYGALVAREGVKLSQMVEQILEFAGARSGKRKYDLHRTSVEKIIENALEECAPLLREKDFAVEKEIAEHLPPVAADEKALSRAIQNLLVNAVKYAGGSARLKIAARSNSGDGEIKIIVEDEGVGIAPTDLKHIFEPFYRAETVVDQQIHGNGLGLSLVKQTVEAHGGTVSATSEIGRGSRFTITLPSQIRRRQRAAEPAPARPLDF